MGKKLTGDDKAAILLMALGEETAAEILRHLDPKDLRQIGGVIDGMKDVPPEDVVSVLEEFSTLTGHRVALPIGGKQFLQKALIRAVGSESAGRIIESMSTGTVESMDVLKWLDPQSIAKMIEKEHPQTIALILAYMDPDQSGEVIMHLPGASRSDVAFRMATLKDIPPGIVKEISDVLQNEINKLGTTAKREVGGVKVVADLLNRVDPTVEKDILDSISQMDSDMADQIRRSMFIFDDLARLDDRAMQEILKGVGKEDLALSLKAAKEEVKEKIFRNMSERAALTLREDLETRGPVKLSDVENAQQAVLSVARKLVEEGKIMIGGKGQANAMV